MSTAIAAPAPDLTISRTALRDALSVVFRAVPTRTTLPILTTVLIQTEDDRVTFTATDLDMWIRVDMPANVWGDGTVAVPAKLLKDLVGKQSGADVQIKPGKQDHAVTVSCNGSKGNILGLDPDQFPALESGDVTGGFEMEAGPLTDYLSRSLWATSEDEARAVLCSVYLSLETDCVDFVATDTHVMGHSKHRGEYEDPFSCLIPGEAAKTIIAALSARADDEVVTVEYTGPRLSFRVGNLMITTRLIDGQYANWKRVIPTDFPGIYTVDCGELTAAVDRASMFTDMHGRLIFTYDAVAGEIVITAENVEAGTTEERVKADVTGTLQPQWALAKTFFKSLLGSMPGGKITIANNRDLGPWVFHPVGNQDYTAICMPLEVR